MRSVSADGRADVDPATRPGNVLDRRHGVGRRGANLLVVRRAGRGRRRGGGGRRPVARPLLRAQRATRRGGVGEGARCVSSATTWVTWRSRRPARRQRCPEQGHADAGGDDQDRDDAEGDAERAEDGGTRGRVLSRLHAVTASGPNSPARGYVNPDILGRNITTRDGSWKFGAPAHLEIEVPATETTRAVLGSWTRSGTAADTRV